MILVFALIILIVLFMIELSLNSSILAMIEQLEDNEEKYSK